MHGWHDSQDYKICKTLKWERTSVNANINSRAESLVACTLKYCSYKWIILSQLCGKMHRSNPLLWLYFVETLQGKTVMSSMFRTMARIAFCVF